MINQLLINFKNIYQNLYYYSTTTTTNLRLFYCTRPNYKEMSKQVFRKVASLLSTNKPGVIKLRHYHSCLVAVTTCLAGTFSS